RTAHPGRPESGLAKAYDTGDCPSAVDHSPCRADSGAGSGPHCRTRQPSAAARCQWRLCPAVGRATKNRRPVARRRFLVTLTVSEAEHPEHQVVGHDADNGDAGEVELEAGIDHVADLHVAGTE